MVIDMIRKGIKFAIDEFKEFFKNLGIVCKYLTVLGIISLIVVCISIFHPELDATGNLVTIRTTFSSISGYILEKSTKNCTSDTRLLKNKILLVGSFSIIAMIIITLGYIFNIDVNNPSLVLIKNLLFSSIGFLTSANKDFSKKDS